MKKIIILVVSVLALYGCTQSSGFQKLDEWTQIWKEGQQTYFGYPVNQESALQDFYEWYIRTGMDRVNLNNAGDPMTDKPWNMSTQAFERDDGLYSILAAGVDAYRLAVLAERIQQHRVLQTSCAGSMQQV